MRYGDSNSPVDLSGTVLDRYRIVRRIGHGGMGTVYEAQHQMLDRRCAIKVLAPRLASMELARKRFLREARAASRIDHDNVVEIYDVGFSDDYVYFAMELLRGEDLDQRLGEHGRMSWAEAKPIALQAIAGIAAAHQASVIHRDIKPANCFLLDGPTPRVKVLDFGIASLASHADDGATALTGTGDVMGTAGYLPPETAEGISKDPRSDLYSMGVMLFRMMTGQLPFEGSQLEVMAQHIGREPPDPRSMEPSIPPELSQVILRCLEKQPEDRYASMHELSAALRPIGAPVEQAPAAPNVRVPEGEPQVVPLDERPVVPPSRKRADPGWTTPYGNDPPPPPPAGLTDANLQLDVPEGWQPGDRVQPKPDAPRRPISLRPLLMAIGVIALVAAGVTAWTYRSEIAQSVPDDVGVGWGDSDEAILLLVDTVPKDAQVFIDDEPHDERPVRLPKSETPVRVRVEAEGYQPRTVQVQPTTTRRIEIELQRARRKRAGDQ